jgi:hypothetical protein
VLWRELTLIGARIYDRSDFEEAVRLPASGEPLSPATAAYWAGIPVDGGWLAR